jgi:NAD(P)-dependent dehydrogenase (short-subunit alcohol dehydrogenase family)
MKIVLFGANGSLGQQVHKALAASGHEIVKIGRSTGDLQANIEDPSSVAAAYKKIGSFDAVVSAAGESAFAPLADLGPAQWKLTWDSKIMGQINMVQQALPYISEKGSFTLVSGILTDEPIFAGTAASVADRAIEGFVIAAAGELPKGLRINAVSPSLLVESLEKYGPFFPGFVPVEGARVAQAFKKSVMGIQTGQILKVF